MNGSPAMPPDYAQWMQQLALRAPSPFYLQTDDNPVLTVWNAASGVTVTLFGRQLTSEGRIVDFQTTLTPATNRTASSVVTLTTDGWLLNLTVIVTGGTPQIGQTFARIGVVKGQSASSPEYWSLCRGYITAAQRLIWPGGIFDVSQDGPGALRSITGTDPAAGAEISETVPTGARWQPLAVRATIVTSAAVTNRVPELIFDDGTNELLRAGTSATTAASTTAHYSYAAFGNFITQSPSLINVPFPANLVLLGGYRIRTGTVNLDVGDNYAAPQLLVREWMEL